MFVFDILFFLCFILFNCHLFFLFMFSFSVFYCCFFFSSRRRHTICLSDFFFFFSSRRRHTRCLSDWSSDVCSSDLAAASTALRGGRRGRAETDVGVGVNQTRIDRHSRCVNHAGVARDRNVGADGLDQIGRASCRERGEIWGGGGG